MGRTKKGFRKCYWDHCDQDNMIDLKKDSYVKDEKNNRCYHEKCWQERNKLQEIVSAFLQKVDKNASIAHLRKEVNRLVYEEKVSSDFVLFIVNYAADHQMGLRYPAGIKFYLNNQEITEAYNRKILPKYAIEDFQVEAAAVEQNVEMAKARATGKRR